MTASDAKEETIATIVAAFAGRPDATPAEIVDLYRQLSGEQSAQPAVATPKPRLHAKPAMPVDQAITRDKVFCLCCGKGFKMLKRHLGAEHGLSEAEYRAMFDLSDDIPLVAPSYSKKKADYAKGAGFGKYDRDPQRKSEPNEQVG